MPKKARGTKTKAKRGRRVDCESKKRACSDIQHCRGLMLFGSERTSNSIWSEVAAVHFLLEHFMLHVEAGVFFGVGFCRSENGMSD